MLFPSCCGVGGSGGGAFVPVCVCVIQWVGIIATPPPPPFQQHPMFFAAKGLRCLLCAAMFKQKIPFEKMCFLKWTKVDQIIMPPTSLGQPQSQVFQARSTCPRSFGTE